MRIFLESSTFIIVPSIVRSIVPPLLYPSILLCCSAVFNALRTLCRLDSRQDEAVEVRQELDLRIGASFTRFQTLYLRPRFQQNLADSKVISYGPCQFPTLGLVVERYREIEKFIGEPFWTIKGLLSLGLLFSFLYGLLVLPLVLF